MKEGLATPDDPFKQQLREWVFGSEDFLRRMAALAEETDRRRHQSTSRRLHRVSVEEILEATASRHGVDASQYAQFRSSAAGRDMAAWLGNSQQKTYPQVVAEVVRLPAPELSRVRLRVRYLFRVALCRRWTGTRRSANLVQPLG